MKSVKLFFVALWWLIRWDDIIVTFVRTKKTKYIANTKANREWLEKWEGRGIYKNIEFVLTSVNYFGRDACGGLIICMSLPSTGQVVTARIAFPDDHGGIVERARLIKTNCTSNIWVIFSPAEITNLGVLINTYEDAHGAARVVAYNALNNLLKNTFLKRIEDAAIADPIHAIVLIQACGMHVQGVGGAHQITFDGFNGIESGTMILVGPSGPSYSCHEWWYSKDNITWIRLEGSMEGNKLVTGLVPAEYAWFRHQIIDKKGGTGMSDPIKRLVN